MALLNRAPDPPQINSPNASRKPKAAPARRGNSPRLGKPATRFPYEHSPFELARKAGVTRATMTGLLDGAGTRGLGHPRPAATPIRRMQDRPALTPAGVSSSNVSIPIYYRRDRPVAAHGLKQRPKQKDTGYADPKRNGPAGLS